MNVSESYFLVSESVTKVWLQHSFHLTYLLVGTLVVRIAQFVTRLVFLLLPHVLPPVPAISLLWPVSAVK